MRHHRFHRITVLALCLLLVGLLAPGAAAATSSCRVSWGSLAKSAGTMQDTPLLRARAGRHECYDRLVLELSGAPAAGYRVRYVDRVRGIGSGDPIPLRGGAALQIDVLAPAYDAHGATMAPADPAEVVGVRRFRTFRQVAWGGSFEGQTLLGLGVRARLPFRVFTLPGPGAKHRLVVDVAHRW